MFKNRKKRRLHEILLCGKSQRTWLSHELSFLCKKHTCTRTAESKMPCRPTKTPLENPTSPMAPFQPLFLFRKYPRIAKSADIFVRAATLLCLSNTVFSARPEHDWAAHNKSASVITAHCRLRPAIPSIVLSLDKICCGVSCRPSVNADVGDRVASEPVCAVNAAGNFSCSKQTGNNGAGIIQRF